MTQSFFVASKQSASEGTSVPRETTVSDVKAIMEGAYDKLEPDEFLFIGSLADLKQSDASSSTQQPAAAATK